MELKNLVVCPVCSLNPNDLQSDEQQKDESDYVKEVGCCSACKVELDEDQPIKCADCGYKITEPQNIFEGKNESYICPKCKYEGYSNRFNKQ